ncbi:hypothetical protein C8Q75DRAFT_808721 [Abortiporus biennis]|nr:hypothetical protein C8Q75DRAFT_808721 [Abortiporus biennis]
MKSFTHLTFGFILLAAVTTITQVKATCPAERSLSLCCSSLGKFSDNSNVWRNVCGFHDPIDPNTPTAAGCSAIDCVFDGLWDVCCESLMPCPESTSGAIALNCTGSIVH